jgi:hypothetical protein
LDDETTRAIFDIRADTVALRAVMKIVLQRVYGFGDETLSVVREDAMAAIETALRDIDGDELQQHFHQAVRETVRDLLTPLPR